MDGIQLITFCSVWKGDKIRTNRKRTSHSAMLIFAFIISTDFLEQLQRIFYHVNSDRRSFFLSHWNRSNWLWNWSSPHPEQHNMARNIVIYRSNSVGTRSAKTPNWMHKSVQINLLVWRMTFPVHLSSDTYRSDECIYWLIGQSSVINILSQSFISSSSGCDKRELLSKTKHRCF